MSKQKGPTKAGDSNKPVTRHGAVPPAPTPRRPLRHSANFPPGTETISETKVKRARYTPAEDAYIQANYGILTLQQIADELGRSTSGVDDRAKKLGVKHKAKEAACKISVIKNEIEKKKSENKYEDGWMIEELEFLRDTLRSELKGAPPNILPRLAGEYRETIKEIDSQLKLSPSESKGSILNGLNSKPGKRKARAAN